MTYSWVETTGRLPPGSFAARRPDLRIEVRRRSAQWWQPRLWQQLSPPRSSHRALSCLRPLQCRRCRAWLPATCCASPSPLPWRAAPARVPPPVPPWSSLQWRRRWRRCLRARAAMCWTPGRSCSPPMAHVTPTTVPAAPPSASPGPAPPPTPPPRRAAGQLVAGRLAGDCAGSSQSPAASPSPSLTPRLTGQRAVLHQPRCHARPVGQPAGDPCWRAAGGASRLPDHSDGGQGRPPQHRHCRRAGAGGRRAHGPPAALLR